MPRAQNTHTVEKIRSVLSVLRQINYEYLHVGGGNAAYSARLSEVGGAYFVQLLPRFQPQPLYGKVVYVFGQRLVFQLARLGNALLFLLMASLCTKAQMHATNLHPV